MKSVVLRKYDSAPMAYVDAERLRSEGIDCQVMEESAFASLMSGSVHLIVLEDQKEEAEKILGLK